MTQYAVAEGRGVLYKGVRRPAPAGTLIPDGVFSKDRIDELVEQGFLVEAVVFEESEPTPPAPKVRGKWRVDPDLTKDCDLDTLNIMIQEIEPGMDLFETVEEARTQLSMDF